MIETIIIIVITFISLFLLWDYIKNKKYSSGNESSFYHPRNRFDDISYNEPMHKKRKVSTEKIKNEFNVIIQSIIKGFHPDFIKDEEDCENQLLKFLKKRYPNKIFSHGHTSRGLKIDLVMEGTYAIELITLDNEGKLLSLIDKMLKSKQDFEKIAVILVDINKIPTSKIKEYILEFEQIGIKPILKKA